MVPIVMPSHGLTVALRQGVAHARSISGPGWSSPARLYNRGCARSVSSARKRCAWPAPWSALSLARAARRGL